MTWGAVGAAAVTVVGGAIQSDSARKAANTEADAAREAAAANAAMYAHSRQVGDTALDRIALGSQSGGEFNKPFSMADATNSSAEQEAQRAGSEVIQNSAAAKGGLIGSNVMQDLTKFGEANAAQYQKQAFDQYMADRSQQLGIQQSLAGIGMDSTKSVADTNANATLAAGGAMAGNQIAQGNAVTGTISQLGNILGQSDLFKPKASQPGAYTTPNLNGTYNNPTVGGGGVGISAPGGAGSAGDYSDERLKTDIRRVGTTDAGLPIYTYRMHSGGPRKMGVMAQDVEHVTPHAVTQDPAGFKMVDYSQVH